MDVAIQRRTLVTRDAYSALRNLKKLIDTATEKLHAAELETVEAAITHKQANDALRTLLSAADSLRSSSLDAALEEARLKTETAVAWHQPGNPE